MPFTHWRSLCILVHQIQKWMWSSHTCLNTSLWWNFAYELFVARAIIRCRHFNLRHSRCEDKNVKRVLRYLLWCHADNLSCFTLEWSEILTACHADNLSCFPYIFEVHLKAIYLSFCKSSVACCMKCYKRYLLVIGQLEQWCDFWVNCFCSVLWSFKGNISGVIFNVGIALIVIVVELRQDALFHGVLCAQTKITHSA
jgi:hypothetical protein